MSETVSLFERTLCSLFLENSFSIELTRWGSKCSTTTLDAKFTPTFLSNFAVVDIPDSTGRQSGLSTAIEQ